MQPADKVGSLDPEHMAVRVCLARLIFLLFLLIPLSLTWMVSPEEDTTYSVLPELGYQIFLICGFLLTIVFLLVRNRFSNRIAFFWIQLGADLTLVCFLLLISGGLKSNFAFIGLALLFLYGRTLGQRAANTLAACLGVFYLGLALFQTMNFVHPLGLDEACLFSSLHLLALALMLLLVRMHAGGVNSLVQEMAERDRRLRHSESIKRKVMDWMSSGLLVVDRQGLVSTINPQALSWAHLRDISQAVSRPLAEIFPGLHARWSRWDGQEPVRTEFHFSDHLFGATLTQLPDQQGTLILFSEITRIKELERQVQEMEKMATVGELAAGLAHEIKNPLAGIKASLQLLPSSSLPEEKRKRLYQVVEHDIQRLSHLLTNFLTFARPKEAKAENIHLTEMVRSCLFTLQTEFDHVHFETRNIPEGTCWNWDPDHLHQILLNILMNAAQAASNREKPWVGIGWEETEENESIWIQDNGPGLDPKITGRLFDPFTTTKAQGSGLGLSIAQRLAHQNKARIEITQNTGLDHGVTARIIINREP
ncbi:MAG: ATP-binding protein [Desulfovermiculus sp.]|nr:ATP-binding protein [Desulfovermiculus sp.]